MRVALHSGSFAVQVPLNVLRLCVYHRSCLTPFFSAGACVLEASGASCNIDLGLALIAHAHRTPFLLVLNEGLLNVCCFVCASLFMFDPVFLCRG